MGVQVAGLKQTVKALEEAGTEVADLKDAFQAIAAEVADEAKPLIHSQTGRLAKTVRAARTKNKAVVRAGSTSVAYARYVNYRPGTRSTGFLTTPANEHLDKRIERLQDAITDLITRLNLD